MSVIAFIGMTIEMVILYYYFSTNLERRYSKIKSFLIFWVCEGLNIIKCVLMSDITVLKFVTTVIVQFLLLSILYKDKLYKKIVVYMTYLLSVILAEVLSMLIAKYVYHSNLTNTMEFSIENVLWSVTAYLFLFVFCVLGALFLKNKKIDADNRVTQYICLYVGIQFIIVTLFFSFICQFMITAVLMMCVLMFFATASFIVAFILFRAIQKLSKKTAEAEFIKKEADIKDKHFFEIKAQYMEYRKLRHDFYNHIKVLDNLDDSEKVKKYIDEIKQKFDSMERVSYCNNPSLDALLSLKNKEADAEKIKTRIAVCDLAGVTVKDYDICSVVANLFDNAIEAAKQTQEKYIDLEINLKADRLFIVVKNSSNEPEKTLKTTKKDKEHHGIGLQSVKETAEKYDGDCVFRYDNGEFVSLVNMTCQTKN